MSGLPRVHLILFTAYLLGCVGTVFCAVVAPGQFPGAMAVTAGVFFLFSLVHAVGRLGGWNALLFLAIALVGSLAFETAGVTTGLVYGPYYYTERLGWKLPGGVPALIPAVWFVMLYASHGLAEIICGGRDGGRSPGRIAALTAVAMTAWDLVIDPTMVARGGWVWLEHGAYFGIPLVNFAGWFVTGFTITLLYGCCEGERPNGGPADRPSNSLGILSYAVTGLTSVLGGIVSGQPGPALIALLIMGGLLLAAGTAIPSPRPAPCPRLSVRLADLDSLWAGKTSAESGLVSV